MSSTNGQPVATCVVVPTYNNKLTIANVTKEVLNITPDLVVVDDGSSDGTSEVLCSIPEVVVLTNERNLGKGAALSHGMQFIYDRGYTHVISMDGDGQHRPSDLPKFFEAIKENPGSFVVGNRDLSGRGKRIKSRILRTHSNFWVWTLTGKWIRDSQSGFRAYPLGRTEELLLRTTKYDFEVEILVKGLWAGIPVVEVPVEVDYVAGSRSHFRPFFDFMLVFRLISVLMLHKIFIPNPLLKLMHLKSYNERTNQRRSLRVLLDTVFHECPTARRLALSAGLGAFCGIAPIWGFQMSAAVLAAHKLRLSKAVSLIASNISFPAAIPFIVYASVMLGRLILGGTIDNSIKPDNTQPFAAASVYAAEYIAGSFVLATMTAVIVALLCLLTLQLASLLGRRNK